MHTNFTDKVLQRRVNAVLNCKTTKKETWKEDLEKILEEISTLTLKEIREIGTLTGAGISGKVAKKVAIEKLRTSVINFRK